MSCIAFSSILALLFAVLLPVWSCHSTPCLRQNGCNTHEHKGKTDWKSNDRFGFSRKLTTVSGCSLSPPHRVLTIGCEIHYDASMHDSLSVIRIWGQYHVFSILVAILHACTHGKRHTCSGCHSPQFSPVYVVRMTRNSVRRFSALHASRLASSGRASMKDSVSVSPTCRKGYCSTWRRLTTFGRVSP